jgi:hypothetical protein
MRPRAWRVIAAAVATCAATAAACNSINGLDKFEKVDCIGPCNDAEPLPDVVEDKNETGNDVVEAGAEDVREAEASGPDVIEHDAPSTEARRWARWPMPNFPRDADAGLPNGAKYAVIADGGVVYDEVTHMQWESIPDGTTMTYQEAVEHCKSLALDKRSWSLPTRIELVSLLDPTNTPSIDLKSFPGTFPEKYWSSSPVSGSQDPQQWTVDFSSASVQSVKANATTMWRVRCVSP